MPITRFTAGLISFVLAALFLAFDLFNVGFALGRTSVSIYPVVFFALLGVVLVVPSRRDRRIRGR